MSPILLNLLFLEVLSPKWATDWVLKKLIDQRVADAKRVGSAHKRKRGDEKRKGKKLLLSRTILIISILIITIYDTSHPARVFHRA